MGATAVHARTVLSRCVQIENDTDTYLLSPFLLAVGGLSQKLLRADARNALVELSDTATLLQTKALNSVAFDARPVLTFSGFFCFALLCFDVLLVLAHAMTRSALW